MAHLVAHEVQKGLWNTYFQSHMGDYSNLDPGNMKLIFKLQIWGFGGYPNNKWHHPTTFFFIRGHHLVTILNSALPFGSRGCLLAILHHRRMHEAIVHHFLSSKTHSNKLRGNNPHQILEATTSKGVIKTWEDFFRLSNIFNHLIHWK